MLEITFLHATFDNRRQEINPPCRWKNWICTGIFRQPESSFVKMLDKAL
jgi:hypothetical protein